MKIRILGHGGKALTLLPPDVSPGGRGSSPSDYDAFGLHASVYGALFLHETLQKLMGRRTVEPCRPQPILHATPTWVMRLKAYDLVTKGNHGQACVRIDDKIPIVIKEDLQLDTQARKPMLFWKADRGTADLNVVFFDAGLDFKGMRPKTLGPSPLLVCLSASSRIESDERKRSIAQHLRKLCQAAREEATLVLSFRTLTLIGLPMPNCASWERFAQECARCLTAKNARSPQSSLIKAITGFKHVVVRFGPLAAYVQTRNAPTCTRELHYVVDYDGVPASHPGYMSGFTAVLAISLAQQFAASKPEGFTEAWLKEGLSTGLRRCAILEDYGYGLSAPQESTAPQNAKEFNPRWAVDLFNIELEKPTTVHSIPVPSPDEERHERWSVLSQVIWMKAGTNPREGGNPSDEETEEAAVAIGQEIVTKGVEAAREKYNIAFSRFCDLTIVDRREFEDYVEVQSLLMRYIANKSEEKPLSLAVFGPPGNGKSFGITQVARAANADSKDQIYEANIAQLNDVRDLATILHRTRDLGVGTDRPPLVLLDEFDASLHGRPFGWLEYFLSPMQDGTFKDANATYNIGRAILVFIGGVNHSFDMLQSRMRNREFIEAKGPDFVSRLRGHLDVLGISLQHDDKPCVIVRRAVLLRDFLKRYHPAIQSRDRFNVASEFVRAFLTVKDFRHGVRSMEALVRMCKVDPAENSLHLGSLPTEGQMHMHVDYHEFWNRVRGPRNRGTS